MDVCKMKPWEQVRSLDEVRTVFKTIRSEYYTHSARKLIYDTLSQNVERVKQIDRLICVGLGSMSGPEDFKDVLWQFAAFLDVSFILDLKSGGTIEMTVMPPDLFDSAKAFCQDPGFNTADKEFLKGFGVEVINATSTPDAWELVTRNTLLFLPHFPLTHAPIGLFYTRDGLEKRTNYLHDHAKNNIEEAKGTMPDKIWEEKMKNPYTYPESLRKDIKFQGERPAIVICNDLKNVAEKDSSPLLANYTGTSIDLHPDPRDPHPGNRAFGLQVLYVRNLEADAAI